MTAQAQPRYLVDEHGRRVAVIVPLEEYEALVQAQRRKRARQAFSFADLVGKLEWIGDPLAAQRQLRNEW
jgi:hypothetical protein